MRHLPLLALLVFARTALAEAPPPAQARAESLVKSELIEPLTKKERHQSKFSRARLPPEERRVRILDEQPRPDGHGGAYVSFAVDARFGMLDDGEDGWNVSVTGCVYPATGKVFVKIGDRHRPADFLLGKNRKPVAEYICVAPTS